MKKSEYAVAKRVAPVAEQLDAGIAELGGSLHDYGRRQRLVLETLRADTAAVEALERLRLERAGAEQVERWDRYLDVATSLRRAVWVAKTLRLPWYAHGSLLDIGCGASYLGYAVRAAYGIEPLGFDLPEPEIPISRRIAGILGQPIHAHRLEPYKALPELGRCFDAVTLVSPQFYRKSETTFWSEAEWSDLFARLFEAYVRPGGFVLLLLNLKKRQGSGRYDHADLFAAVARIPGHRVDGAAIWLPRPE